MVFFRSNFLSSRHLIKTRTQQTDSFKRAEIIRANFNYIEAHRTRSHTYTAISSGASMRAFDLITAAMRKRVCSTQCHEIERCTECTKAKKTTATKNKRQRATRNFVSKVKIKLKMNTCVN